MITEKEYYQTTIKLVSDEIITPVVEKDGSLGYWILANDMFAYSTADADPVDGISHPALAGLYRDYGVAGIVAWLAHSRKVNPISERMDDAFIAARKAIRSGECDPLLDNDITLAVAPEDVAFVVTAKDLLWLHAQKTIDFIILEPDDDERHNRSFEAKTTIGTLPIYLFFVKALTDKTCRHKEVFLAEGLGGLKRFIEQEKGDA